MKTNRHKNLLLGSQLFLHGTLKENIYTNHQKIILRNFSKGSRQPSQETKPFRNITNIFGARGQNDEALMKKLKNVITRKKKKLIISRSFTNREQDAHKTVNLFPSKPECIKSTNPQFCEEYAEEIDNYLKKIETRYLPKANHMNNQKDITISMRAILIDWLVDVHIRFKLLPETLFLTVNIIDRYLSKQQVTKEYLQLVGITASIIASKYEEIYPPEIKDYIYITNYTYIKEDVLNMEERILSTINFDLNVPSSNRFLQRFSKFLGSPKKTVLFAQYLLELSLIDAAMLNYYPSLLAASSLYMSHKLNNDTKNWGEEMWKLTGESGKSLNPCIKNMIRLLEEVPTMELKAVKKKFATVKYLEVSQIKICKKN